MKDPFNLRCPHCKKDIFYADVMVQIGAAMGGRLIVEADEKHGEQRDDSGDSASDSFGDSSTP